MFFYFDFRKTKTKIRHRFLDNSVMSLDERRIFLSLLIRAYGRVCFRF